MANGIPKIKATTNAIGKPTNQTRGIAHQLLVPLNRPIPHVVEVAKATPIIAATHSIEIVRSIFFIRNLMNLNPHTKISARREHQLCAACDIRATTHAMALGTFNATATGQKINRNALAPSAVVMQASATAPVRESGTLEIQ